jgi:hypothetical protein
VHVFFDIDVKGGEKECSGCYSWRYKPTSADFEGFHQCQRGRLLACFAGKSVLVIDGKNRRMIRRKCKLMRRSEQQVEIIAQKGKHSTKSNGD